jgi:hypothetical protein
MLELREVSTGNQPNPYRQGNNVMKQYNVSRRARRKEQNHARAQPFLLPLCLYHKYPPPTITSSSTFLDKFYMFYPVGAALNLNFHQRLGLSMSKIATFCQR